MTNRRCEACEVNQAILKVDERADRSTAYFLCGECDVRLHALALRPIEWYNLAKRHGWWQFHLHDDFYDEEGVAYQPECDVNSPELYPAPVLSEVAGSTEKLLDFTIVRRRSSAGVTKAWRSHRREEVLATLNRRFFETENVGVRSSILNVAVLLEDFAAGFVRKAWAEYPQLVDLPELAEASAHCLPYSEGFNRVATVLTHLDAAKKQELMFSLSYFRSRETLDWIESNVFSSIVEAWGALAASSKFDWSRAVSWLERGRPLSLVSLDALAAIINPRTLLLKRFSPRLYDPPSDESLFRALQSHAARDPVLRVEKLTRFILQNSTVLIDPP